ncbi:hypothetical protein CKAN_01979100 [Cinnamomum micranthum f. kanehirae]|uniref:Nucleoporin protein Ndc1-Nup n=1 Tax=Cinnamomum micranthum f. kanehirae TaxID=337451 RepID=A0A3S3NMJ7_9MAGN|nr:hypothetical protein CKAN_01979100 [Cinnamomum micranthum f. kanehirae]
MVPLENTFKNRWLWALLSQFISSPFLFFLHRDFIFTHFYKPSSSFPRLTVVLAFSFLLSNLTLFISLIVLAFPEPFPSVYQRRFTKSITFVVFLLLCASSGILFVVSFCCGPEPFDKPEFLRLALRGFVFGTLFGVDYLHRKRWVLIFPVIQDPLVRSLILGNPSSIRDALKLSSSAYVISTVLMLFLPDLFKIKDTMWQLLVQQIAIYLETSVVSFYWEQTLHFFQVVSTRRFIFMPQQESAAPRTNPSEPLLAAIEQSTPRSIFQYCAYLDLCMISESNVETWRRAAFFEETGKTYRRVISVCLRPLEQLTSRLGEGLKGSLAENSDLLSQRLSSPMVNHADLRLHEAFYDFQLCSWSARTVASLTACSRDEDRFGVARFTGCNAAVVSTLLSCLLAVEACLGKKTNPQSPHLLSPTNIWRATVDSGKRDFVCKKTESTLHEKAYGMADVLGASICQIVSAFHDEMQKGAKAGILAKDWIIKSKPLHSTREILVHKLSLFLISKPTEDMMHEDLQLNEKKIW